MLKFTYVSLLSVLLLSNLALAEETKTLLNLDKNGLAIQGYDPVAYFTDSKPVKGDPSITSTHKGATYHFATKEHKEAFEKEPQKYEPEFGGYCGYGASRNALFAISPDAFVIMNGRLILQKSKTVLGYWNENPVGNLKKANANWPGLVKENGK
jgi:YHS domain-containing protein